MQRESPATPLRTPCIDDGLHSSRPGNAVGSPHRTNDRASAPPGAGKKVRFVVRDPKHLIHTVSESEPVRGAVTSSHGKAAVGPDGTQGRAVASPGSRGVRAGVPPPSGGRPTAGFDPSSASWCSNSVAEIPSSSTAFAPSAPHLGGRGASDSPDAVAVANELAHLTNSPTDKMQSPLVFLYDDENGIRQQVLRDIGLRTFAVQVRRNYSHEHLRHQLQELELQRPDIIWLRVHGCRTPRGDRHDQRQSRTTQAIVCTQLQRRGDVIVEGNARDSTWDLEGHSAVLRDPRLRVTRHLWCQSGVVDPDTKLPVHRCTLLLSSLFIPDRSSCVCSSRPQEVRIPMAKNSHNLLMNIGFITDLVRVIDLSRHGRHLAAHSSGVGHQGDVPESNQSNHSSNNDNYNSNTPIIKSKENTNTRNDSEA